MRFSAAMLVLSLVACAGLRPDTAYACEVPVLAGVWENPRVERDQEVTRIEIAHICEKGHTGGRAVLPGATWTIRVFSKCSPRDCKWGRERGEIDADGRLFVIFETFSARRTLHIAAGGDAIYVDMEIDYHGEKATDRKESLVLVAEN